MAQNVTAGYSERKQLSKNYRSSKPVLDFINKIFEGIYPWSEQKLYPGLDIEIPSRIEIKISEGEGVKEAEYDWVISKIFELVEKDFQVWDRKSGRLRSIDFRDMAIIMRGRAGSKFSLLEKKLKESGMPFVILGGIGFYSEPEIIFLLSLLFALSDTTDSLSLWTLFNSVHAIDAGDVRRWRKMLRVQEITVLFENILDEKGFWKDLSTQQKANAEKFLMLLQDMQHMPVYAIAKNLRELAFNYDEPKADIFSIRQNAVRVLTVHGAKGLEFPAVFLVNVEDGRVTLRDRLLYERTEGEAAYTYIFKEEADEGTVEDYRRAVKEEEERILYVALTRAGQCLFISGEDKKWGSQLWLGMIRDFERMYPASIRYNYRGIKSSARESKDKISFKEKGEVLTSYSHEAENIFYGYEKRVAGQVIHKLLFEISTGRLRFGEKPFRERAVFYLKKSGLRSISKSLELLMDIYEKIEANEEVKNIVLESMEGKTFSELAFMVEKDGKIYEGFIDRVIIRDGAVNIYDYKTEKGALADYKKQMDIYEAAAMSIFETCNTKKFVVFLREGSVRKIP